MFGSSTYLWCAGGCPFHLSISIDLLEQSSIHTILTKDACLLLKHVSPSPYNPPLPRPRSVRQGVSRCGSVLLENLGDTARGRRDWQPAAGEWKGLPGRPIGALSRNSTHRDRFRSGARTGLDLMKKKKKTPLSFCRSNARPPFLADREHEHNRPLGIGPILYTETCMHVLPRMLCEGKICAYNNRDEFGEKISRFLSVFSQRGPTNGQFAERSAAHSIQIVRIL